MTITIVAAAIGACKLLVRHLRYLDTTEEHAQMATSLQRALLRNKDFGSGTPQQIRKRIDYHREMERKYTRAARYPWLPVAPDPLPPPRPW